MYVYVYIFMCICIYMYIYVCTFGNHECEKRLFNTKHYVGYRDDSNLE